MRANRMTGKPLTAILLAFAIFGVHAAEPAAPVDNPRMARMFEEDQAARRSMPIDWAMVGPMDKAHLAETLALVKSGALRTANDYYRAAMVMQHGTTLADFKLAFSLSQLGATLDPSNKMAKWLSAASWDRILMSKGVPQWYGTQYRSPSPGAPAELYTIDASVVSDEERKALNVPTLAERQQAQ